MTEFLDYKIVKAPNLLDFEAKVKDHIKRGWKPLGGPFIDEQNFLQAMILTREFI